MNTLTQTRDMTDPIQRKAMVSDPLHANTLSDPLSDARHISQKAASPLPHSGAVRAQFPNDDLSSIRTNSSPAALKAADSIQAEAYTVGENIVLPKNPSVKTVAHEVTHVIQQRSGRVKSGSIDGGSADPLEAEATAAEHATAAPSADGGVGATPSPGPGSSAGAIQRSRKKKKKSSAGELGTGKKSESFGEKEWSSKQSKKEKSTGSKGSDDDNAETLDNAEGLEVSGADFESHDANMKKEHAETAAFAGAQAGEGWDGDKADDKDGNAASGYGFAGVGAKASAFSKGGDMKDWLAGEEFAVGAEAKTVAGVGAGLSAKAEGSSGPNIGAIDPETGERMGMVHGKANAEIDAFAGAEASAKAGASVQGLKASANAEASAFAGAKASGKVEAEGVLGDIGGVHLLAGKASAEGEVAVGAGAEAKIGAHAGPLGIGAEAEGEVWAGAKATGEASASGELLGVGVTGAVEGEAFAGAQAKGSVKVALGIDQVGAYAEGEVFAGAKASGEASLAITIVEVEVAKATVEGTVSAGIGAAGKAGVFLDEGKLEAALYGELTFGVGAGVGGEFEMDFLAPINIVLKMLENNGVIGTTDYASLLPQIAGFALSVEDPEMRDKLTTRMAGQPASDAPSVQPATPAAPITAPSPGSGPATGAAPIQRNEKQQADPELDKAHEAFDLFSSAGFAVDAASGTIDGLGAAENPADLIGKLPGPVGQVYDQQIGEMIEAFDMNEAFMTDLPDRITKDLKPVGMSAATKLADIMRTIIGALTGAKDLIVGIFTANPKKVAEAAGKLLSAAGSAASALWNMGGDALKQLGKIKNLWGPIKWAAEKILNAIFGKIFGKGDEYDKEAAGVAEQVQGIKQESHNAVSSALDEQMGKLGPLGALIGPAIEPVFASADTLLGGVVDEAGEHAERLNTLNQSGPISAGPFSFTPLVAAEGIQPMLDAQQAVSGGLSEMAGAGQQVSQNVGQNMSTFTQSVSDQGQGLKDSSDAIVDDGFTAKKAESDQKVAAAKRV